MMLKSPFWTRPTRIIWGMLNDTPIMVSESVSPTDERYRDMNTLSSLVMTYFVRISEYTVFTVVHIKLYALVFNKIT